MGRYFFLMMVCGLLLAACDKEAEVKTSADAQADLNGQASAKATPPPANTGEDPYAGTPSAKAPGLYCMTPGALVDVKPGDTIMMIPGQGCDPHPAASKLAIPEGEASFISANFVPGPRVIYDPNKCNLKQDDTERVDCWSQEISCDPAAVKADVDFGNGVTVGIPFKVIPRGCDADG